MMLMVMVVISVGSDFFIIIFVSVYFLSDHENNEFNIDTAYISCSY